MKFLLNTTFILLTLFLFSSCQKREEPICEENKSADLRISTFSQLDFDIFIDDNLVYRLHGDLFTTGLTITEGERVLKAVQVGNIEGDTLKITLSLDVVRCQEYHWRIP